MSLTRFRLNLNRRNLRLVLGIIWLLDGLLQLQPAMWTMDMVSTIMQPNSQGQPGFISGFLTWATNVFSAHLVAFNAYVAAIQILIGIALILNFAPRVAIVVSVLHAVMVWAIGEGFGVLLTGNALFLMGAPGAVLLYGLLGIAAWPRAGAVDATPPSGWLRPALGVFWIGAAALQLQPAFLASKGLSTAVAGMAQSQPGPLHASINWAAAAIGSHGLIVTIVLALAQLCLGLGVLLVRDVRPWLIISGVWCLVAWWFGQGLGMLLTGMGTDPNVSPLLLLLILTVWYQHQVGEAQKSAQAVPAERASRGPAAPTQLSGA